MTTKFANPHYLPEVCIKVTIINFTVTAKGLEDQLLGELIAKEKPEIEEKRADLVARIAADKKQLKDIEDKILKVIYQAEGNILHDEVLINTLNDAKSTSTIIHIRVQEAEETEQKINSLREAYRSVAVRGSILYFCIADLALVDTMYQYSLGYPNIRFCVKNSRKSGSSGKNRREIIDFPATLSTASTFSAPTHDPVDLYARLKCVEGVFSNAIGIFELFLSFGLLFFDTFPIYTQVASNSA